MLRHVERWWAFSTSVGSMLLLSARSDDVKMLGMRVFKRHGAEETREKVGGSRSKGEVDPREDLFRALISVLE